MRCMTVAVCSDVLECSQLGSHLFQDDSMAVQAFM